MNHALDNVIDLHTHPLGSEAHRAQCRHALDSAGVLMLPNCLTANALVCQQQQLIAMCNAKYSK